MLVSVLTVTWNSVKHIADQINSVQEAAEGVEYEQLIADNASKDGTITVVRQKFPNLFFLSFGENKGFGFANNELAKNAKGKYLLLLNPDMKLERGSLARLVAWADDHPRAGVIGCTLLNSNGEFNKKTAPRRFPRLLDQLLILSKLPHVFPFLVGRYMMSDIDHEVDQRVDAVQGSLMLVRRELYEKLGRLFDPRYFIWFEDVDLCREAAARGFEVWYTPVVRAVDLGGRSFQRRSFLWKQKNFIVSLFRYFQKWGIWQS
ncbi:MAG: glycosyltransferase family 2 protein [Patescibacteria group bacterium]